MLRQKLVLLCLTLSLVLSGCASLVATGVDGRDVRDDGRNRVERDMDVRIANRINAAYVSDARIPALDIRVTSHRGLVTLTGTLPSRELRDRAVQIARDTAEVRGVSNRITIAGAR